MKIQSRNFAFIIYPDSCKYNYVDMIIQLKSLGVAFAVSPLHQPDNDNKKPHYHIILTFDGVKSIDSLSLMADVNGNDFDYKSLVNCNDVSKQLFPHFIIINSLCQYFRYLVHLDSPEKQQFKDFKLIYETLPIENDRYNSIYVGNAFQVRDYLERDCKTSADIQLVELIKSQNILNEFQLIEYLSKTKNEYLIKYVHQNLYFVKNYLFSRCNLRLDKNQMAKIEQLLSAVG